MNASEIWSYEAKAIYHTIVALSRLEAGLELAPLPEMSCSVHSGSESDRLAASSKPPGA